MVTTHVLLGAKATYVGRLRGPQFELAASDRTSEFSVAPSFFTVVVGDALSSCWTTGHKGGHCPHAGLGWAAPCHPHSITPGQTHFFNKYVLNGCTRA